jgi:hypothetical protein
MKNMFNEGNQIHNFMSSSGSGTVINYGSGTDFLTSYGSGYGSGSTSQKVTVSTVPVPVPQHCGSESLLFNLRLEKLYRKSHSYNCNPKTGINPREKIPGNQGKEVNFKVSYLIKLSMIKNSIRI